MSAIGADQRTSLDLGAIGELCSNAFVVLAEPDNMRIQMNGIGLQPTHAIDKYLQQMSSQQQIRLIARCIGTPVVERPGVTGIPEPDRTSLSCDATLFDLLGQAKILKNAHS